MSRVPYLVTIHVTSKGTAILILIILFYYNFYINLFYKLIRKLNLKNNSILKNIKLLYNILKARNY